MEKIEQFFMNVDSFISRHSVHHALTIQAAVYMAVGGVMTYEIERLCHYIVSLF